MSKKKMQGRFPFSRLLLLYFLIGKKGSPSSNLLSKQLRVTAGDGFINEDWLHHKMFVFPLFCHVNLKIFLLFLLVACCLLLLVVCCLLFVVCCLLFVVCCLLFVVCCLLFVVCCCCCCCLLVVACLLDFIS